MKLDHVNVGGDANISSEWEEKKQFVSIFSFHFCLDTKVEQKVKDK